MTVFRLDSVFPALADGYRSAAAAQRRKAARIACEIAASSVGLGDREFLHGLDVLRSELPASAGLRSHLQDLVARLDEEYLKLDELGEEARKAEALRCFSRARAASAVLFALSDDSEEMHEAIYEAIAALDDPSALVKSVEDALRT